MWPQPSPRQNAQSTNEPVFACDNRICRRSALGVLDCAQPAAQIPPAAGRSARRRLLAERGGGGGPDRTCCVAWMGEDGSSSKGRMVLNRDLVQYRVQSTQYSVPGPMSTCSDPELTP